MKIGVIDMGGTKTIAAILEEDGTLLQSRQFATAAKECETHLEAAAECLKTLCRETGIPLSLLAGVGVCCNGITDSDKGILINAPFSGWRDVPVREILEKLLGVPVSIENDGNACALGEWYFGRGKIPHYLWITVSTGVGGAVVADGRLITGSQGMAGEFGHIKVEYEHPVLCSCGQSGCLEAHGSGTAITRMTREYAELHAAFSARLADEELQPDAKGCSALAEKGVPAAVEIYRKAAIYLGRGIGAAVNLLNPQAVVLGGGVSLSYPLLEGTLLQTLRQSVIGSMPLPKVMTSALGYHAAVFGGAALVLRRLEQEGRRNA